MLPFKTSSINVYKSVKDSPGKIALTFDDGPHPYITQKILNVLDMYDVKATFFVIGKNVSSYNEQLKSAIKKGHEIGNHTDSHIALNLQSKERIIEELDSCARKVFDLTGYEMTLMRPPCGSYDERVIKIAASKNYKTILWNIDTHDWSHNSTEKITKNVIKNVHGGDIILFHDYISGASCTVEALKIIIPALKEKGYEFVTVSEMISEQ